MVTSLIGLLFYFVISTDSSFNDNNIEMISSVIQHLNVEQYILVSKSFKIHSLIPRLKELSRRNISGMYLTFENLINYIEVDKYPNRRAMIVIKIKANDELEMVMEVLRRKVSDKEIFTMFTWMLLLPQNPTNMTKNNFYVPFDCQFFVAQESQILGIYQIHEKSEMTHLYFGEFKEGRLKTNGNFFYERKLNMRKEIMVMKRNDYVICRWVSECLHLEIWKDMGNALNFTPTYVKISELEKNPNNLPKPAATTNLTVFHGEPNPTGTILGPLLVQVAHLYIKEVDEDDDRWDAYLRPLSTKLWAVLVSWLLVASLVILIAAWAALNLFSLRGFTLFDQALIPLSAFCDQGCENLPDILSSRMARLSAYITSTIMIPAYSASLISFLTVFTPKIPFTDYESLVQEGSYKLAPFYNRFLVMYFLYHDDPLIEQIRKNQLLPVERFPKTHKEAVELICTDERIVVLNYNYRMFEYPSTCSFMIVSDVIINAVGGIHVMEEGIKYMESFQNIVYRIRSSGILQRLKKINMGQMKLKEVPDVTPIDIAATKSVMAYFLISILVCLLLFIMEWLYYRIKSSVKFKYTGRSQPRISVITRRYRGKNRENLRRASHQRRYSWFIKNHDQP